MGYTIQILHDTYRNLKNMEYVLYEGEPSYDLTHRKVKVGDGKSLWADLDYTGDNFIVRIYRSVIRKIHNRNKGV